MSFGSALEESTVIIDENFPNHLCGKVSKITLDLKMFTYSVLGVQIKISKYFRFLLSATVFASSQNKTSDNITWCKIKYATGSRTRAAWVKSRNPNR